MKILVYNFYNKNNIGDDLYPIVFPQLFPQHQLRFTAEPSREDIHWCDQVLLGGGNILNKPFLTRINTLIHDNPKPLKALSVGFADHTVDTDDFRFFSRIVVRDWKSQRKLAALKITADFAPDAAWMLEPDPAQGQQQWKDIFKLDDAHLYAKKVVVVLNGHLTYRSPDQLSREALAFQLFSYQMAEIIDNTSASFLFLPFGTEIPADDRVANGWIANKCKWYKKNSVIWNSLNVQSTLNIIASADAVISSRYHSSLFSLVSGTQFIDILHHDKNRGLLEVENKARYGISFWDFNKERTFNLLKEILRSERSDVEELKELRRKQIKDCTTDFWS